VIEVWVVRDKEGVSITTTRTDATGTLNVVQDRFATAKEGVSTLITTFVVMIVNVVIAMISAIRIGIDVSVQQVKAAHKVSTVAMDKAVSGCAVRGVANLARYLRWP